VALGSVVVVGGGLAALRAAEELRRQGFDGRLRVVGEERHPPYDRPPLSKQLLAGAWGPDQLALRDERALEALDIEWLLGERVGSLDLDDRLVVLGDGARVPFGGLVIATGAKPRTLPSTPALEGVHSLRTLEDALALSAALDEPGARVVIVGAGFIGSEVAATCHGRGAEVTLIEALAAPLVGALGREMGEVCGQLHLDHGVALRCGVGVAAIEGDKRVELVRLTDGHAVEADLVVVGVGVYPATGWLEGSGLRLSDGVRCDSGCFAAPGVVAAGDVARWHHRRLGEDIRVEHWTNASEQGAAAARNLLAGQRAAVAYDPVPFFWSDQYDTKIQYVGHTRADDEVRVVHGSVDERRFVAIYGRDGRLTGALAFSRSRQLMKYRRMLADGSGWEEALAAAGE
jgi:3-phenylpropionate/trans-cinnamate dioxygenase ferredoxin reductase subunit